MARTGILYDQSCFAVMRRVASCKGTWFRLRHLPSAKELWIGSIYLAPSLTTLDMQGFLIEHLDKLPATTHPVFFSGDTNGEFHWGLQEDELFPFAHGSKGKTLIDTLQCYHFSITPPRKAQRFQATSNPRRDDVQGHIIDWIACKHATCSSVQICSDSCKEIGTDHDCLLLRTAIRGKLSRSRIQSGVRMVTSPPVLQNHIDQEVLKKLAADHTARRRLRDSRTTR